jgi:hypothetical protein
LSGPDVQKADLSKPFRRPFRKPYTKDLMPADAVARQGKITTIAWEKMREPGGAIAWLNAHDDALGGRPIDLATASVEGFAAVEAAIAART